MVSNNGTQKMFFHHQRDQLAAHIEKGDYIFDIARSQDKLFHEKLCVGNKIITDDQVQHSIMSALAIICSSLNISTQKATRKRMEDFICFLLKLGIQLKTLSKSDDSRPVINIDMMVISSLFDGKGYEGTKRTLTRFNLKNPSKRIFYEHQNKIINEINYIVKSDCNKYASQITQNSSLSSDCRKKKFESRIFQNFIKSFKYYQRKCFQIYTQRR